MAKPLPSNELFGFTLFRRPALDGRVIIYARFLEKATGTIHSQRFLGTDDNREAAARAGQLIVKLPLAKIAKSKLSKSKEDLESAERLRNMDLASFFSWFWTPEALDYLRDREDAEKPLSYYYVLCQSRYIAKHAETYQPFKKTTLREASLYLVEQVMHHLKREKVSANVIADAMAVIRTPLS